MSFVTPCPLLGFQPCSCRSILFFTTVILVIRWNCVTPSILYTLFSLQQSNLNSYFAVYRASILPNCLLSEPSPRQDWLGPLPMSRSTRETRPSGTLLFIYLHRLSLASPYSIVPNTGRFLHRSAVLSTKVDTFLFPHRAVSWPPIAPWNWHRCLTSWEFIETSFSLSLSFSPFPHLSSLVVSIFFIFSFLPFSLEPCWSKQEARLALDFKTHLFLDPRHG